MNKLLNPLMSLTLVVGLVVSGSSKAHAKQIERFDLKQLLVPYERPSAESLNPALFYDNQTLAINRGSTEIVNIWGVLDAYSGSDFSFFNRLKQNDIHFFNIIAVINDPNGVKVGNSYDLNKFISPSRIGYSSARKDCLETAQLLEKSSTPQLEISATGCDDYGSEIQTRVIRAKVTVMSLPSTETKNQDYSLSFH